MFHCYTYNFSFLILPSLLITFPLPDALTFLGSKKWLTLLDYDPKYHLQPDHGSVTHPKMPKGDHKSGINKVQVFQTYQLEMESYVLEK